MFRACGSEVARNLHNIHGKVIRVGVHPGGVVATLPQLSGASAIEQIFPTYLGELRHMPWPGDDIANLVLGQIQGKKRTILPARTSRRGGAKFGRGTQLPK